MKTKPHTTPSYNSSFQPISRVNEFKWQAQGFGSHAGFSAYAANNLFNFDRRHALQSTNNSVICLNKVYSLVAQNQNDDAVDILFDQIDDLLIDGKFMTCNEFLQSVDFKRLDVLLTLAVLSITLSAKKHLPYRAHLYEKARRRLFELAPKRVESLLSGLR